MRRFALIVMPLLVGITGLIGLYFVYVGARTIAAGRYIGIGFGFAGFGAVGLILGYALWSVRKQLLSRLAADAEGSPGTLTTSVVVLLAAAVGSAALPQVVRAQDPAPRDSAAADSARMSLLRTRDGSLFLGRLIRATADSIYFASVGGPIAVPRSIVVELREVDQGAMRAGVYWPPNPGDTRLFFAPTGRMLEKGEGYFSDTYLFFLNFVGGVTSRFTMGGGFSIFPTSDFSNNVFYVTPKLGLVASPNVNVAVGALVGFLGADLLDDGSGLGTFGIMYGVSTFGSADGSITLGTGFGFAGGEVTDRPLIMLGGEKRIARRTSLVTENYVVPGESPAIVSYGLRFFGDRLSVDFAFVNLFGGDQDPIFPGIPYVAFAVRF
jgi:hypothetical protein